jgi:hypothetical protein
LRVPLTTCLVLGRHPTDARRDRRPECEFADGDLRFGSMTNAREGANEASTQPAGEMFVGDIPRS